MGVEEWWDKWNVCGGIAWSEERKVPSEREWDCLERGVEGAL